MVQRHDDPRGEPNWQPVTAVTMMAGMLTGQLAANREQLELLGPGPSRALAAGRRHRGPRQEGVRRPA